VSVEVLGKGCLLQLCDVIMIIYKVAINCSSVIGDFLCEMEF